MTEQSAHKLESTSHPSDNQIRPLSDAELDTVVGGSQSRYLTDAKTLTPPSSPSLIRDVISPVGIFSMTPPSYG